jgi:signal transduction histidine kinase
VPEADRNRIFDRFYRVPGTPGRGSGIGLSLVSRIAKLHAAELETGEGLDGRGLGVTLKFGTCAQGSTATEAPQGSAVQAPAVARPAGSA